MSWSTATIGTSARPSSSALGARPHPDLPPFELRRVRHRAGGVAAPRRGRLRPRDPRRRGSPGRRPGHRPADEGRDLPGAAGPRASPAARRTPGSPRGRARRPRCRIPSTRCAWPRPSSISPAACCSRPRASHEHVARCPGGAHRGARPRRLVHVVGDGRDPVRQRHSRADRRIRRRPPQQGGDAGGDAGTRRCHVSPRCAHAGRGSRRRHRRHRRRPCAHRQHLDDVGRGDRRRGRARRQARQPGRVQRQRLGRRPRGARRPTGRPAAQARRRPDRGRHHVLLRAGVPRVVPVRGRAAP